MEYKYTSNVHDLLTTLIWHGVEKAICSPEPHGWLISNQAMTDRQTIATKDIPYAQDNISLLELKEKYDINNIILPFRIIDTRRKVKEQIKTAEQNLKDKSFYWIKFHCQVLDANITDIDNTDIIPFLKESKLPVLLHSWIRKDKRLSSHIFALAEKYPEINFCTAHMWRFEKKFWDLCNNKGIPPNLFIDTSPFYTVCHLIDGYTDQNILAKILKLDFKQTKDIFKEFAERYQDNLMRGSDYPYTSYPWYQWSYKENIDLLGILDEATRTKISQKNTLHFLWDINI